MSGVRIKICGITNPADAELAVRLGADALGFNLYPPSPRYIAPAEVSEIASTLPPFVEPVLVFANAPISQVVQTAQALCFKRTVHYLQWHGDDPELPPGWPWRFIPAFAVADSAALTRITSYIERCKAGALPAAVLIDGHLPGQFGGTGRPAPWQLLADFHPGVPVILAGGLTPENVAEAIRIVRPYAVDVASGVESAPGVKDAERMRRFIDEVRGAIC